MVFPLGYVELELELKAKYNAFQHSQRRLMDHELKLREDLHALELDLIPIRYLSSQSNVKSNVIKKQNHLLGWIPHTDSYVLIQNSRDCHSSTCKLGARE